MMIQYLFEMETKHSYFKGTDESGVAYRVREWTDQGLYQASKSGTCGDDDPRAEDLFDV